MTPSAAVAIAVTSNDPPGNPEVPYAIGKHLKCTPAKDQKHLCLDCYEIGYWHVLEIQHKSPRMKSCLG
jgi:hypothetical protein